ncbi:hypothetical protein [Candidatus Synchoanobacter obligatus]|nr:hypothetical protein [Candidatus Synchoanobacter obligatus]
MSVKNFHLLRVESDGESILFREEVNEVLSKGLQDISKRYLASG